MPRIAILVQYFTSNVAFNGEERSVSYYAYTIPGSVCLSVCRPLKAIAVHLTSTALLAVRPALLSGGKRERLVSLSLSLGSVHTPPPPPLGQLLLPPPSSLSSLSLSLLLLLQFCPSCVKLGEQIPDSLSLPLPDPKLSLVGRSVGRSVTH